MHLIPILLFLSSTSVYASLPCHRKHFGGTSFVCVCSSSKECDTIDPIEPRSKGEFIVFSSDRQSLRFATKSGHFERSRIDSNPATITIHRNEKLQEMLGFGGAFTDAATKNIFALPVSMQRVLLRSYFGTHGLEYNLCRVPIAGTDFSLRSYSYDDSPTADPTLEKFALPAEDLHWKIPAIKRAMELQPKLQLLASAWTAPKWIKTNEDYTGGTIKTEYLQTWATYYLRFFQEYAKHGVPFWAVTTGNEPSLVLVSSKINTVGWPLRHLKRWIEENLGPTIRNSSHSHVKIFILDDQRFYLPWYPSYVIQTLQLLVFLFIVDQIIQGAAEKIVDGVAVHWYWDKLISPILLDFTHSKFPNKLLLNTESCRGERKGWEPAVILGDWARAEDYAHGMLQDFNHHVQGWIDWNMALNTSGGPTYIGNEVDSPIIVHEQAEEFYKQPIFYAIGHFAKFIPRGSRKIAHSMNANLEVAAFERPDTGIVVVMHNREPSEQTILVRDNDLGHVELQLTAKSINTLLYW